MKEVQVADVLPASNLGDIVVLCSKARLICQPFDNFAPATSNCKEHFLFCCLQPFSGSQQTRQADPLQDSIILATYCQSVKSCA